MHLEERDPQLTDKASRICGMLCKFARPRILLNFRPDSCIASTRIGVDVLRYFRVKTEPIVVKVHVFNKQFMARLDAGQFPSSKEDMDRWYGEDGSHSVGLVSEPPTNIGHVVALVENACILDLSLDQASRPQRGIHLQPSGFAVTEGFLSGGEMRFRIGESTVFYERVLNNRNFLNAPDWTDLNRTKFIVSELIDKITAELKR